MPKKGRKRKEAAVGYPSADEDSGDDNKDKKMETDESSSSSSSASASSSAVVEVKPELTMQEAIANVESLQKSIEDNRKQQDEMKESKEVEKQERIARRNKARGREVPLPAGGPPGAPGSTNENENALTTVECVLQSSDGTVTGDRLQLPLGTTPKELESLVNSLLSNEEQVPYIFFVKDEWGAGEELEIIGDIGATVAKATAGEGDLERVIKITYQPQALFRVRTVTRCAATVVGHSEAVLHVGFSPDGKNLASGSGDTTVRLWDVHTCTPRVTLSGHTNWVLAVTFSPDSKYVASGGMDGTVRVWNAESGELVGKPLTGHTKWITSIAWEPFHNSKNMSALRLASSSKDGTVKIWDLTRRLCVYTLSGHVGAVKAIKWGGQDLLYSASQDRTIMVWDTRNGKLVRSLVGHAHWVNTLSLSTEYVLRQGPFDHKGYRPESDEEAIKVSKEKYDKLVAARGGQELLVSGSDDFTLFLWDPVNSKKPICRMTGHQQPVNFVMFSPDAKYIASASFDGSVRLWHGQTGKFLHTFRGHVQSVYQCAWSADSRLLLTSSKDSTIKVWNINTKKMQSDLPGHSDEVFAVDWSPDGDRVASGGKDRVLKIWMT